MNYRTDKYGNKLSCLGYGCMRFPQKLGRIDIEQTEQQILQAIEGGVNYFDTAYIYPGSEAAVGEIFEKNSLRGRFAVFASEQEGREALRTMLRGPRYGSLTILQAMNKYAPASDGNNPGQYARTIANAIKKPLTTRLSSLSDAELDVVINQIRKKEGWKAGQIIDCNANPSKCK